MIKIFPVPGLKTMAAGAVRFFSILIKLPLVYILVASETRVSQSFEYLFVTFLPMTGLAGCFQVPALQFESGILMIKPYIGPGFFLMTGRAFLIRINFRPDGSHVNVLVAMDTV